MSSSTKVGRVSPLRQKIRGITLPETINEIPTKLRKSPEEGPYTTDQYTEANNLFTAICTERGKDFDLSKTSEDWIGLPVEKLNRGAMKAFIDILKGYPR